MTGEAPAEDWTTLEFQGKAGEYFGIWIVNLLLTVVTLGLYSPWAKVRRLRYFYNNTVLAGARFDYVGQPRAILRGRLLAFGVVVVYAASAHIAPILNLPLFMFLFLATPWLVVRGLLFNRHNTLYRNLRFGFAANYRAALWTYLVVPVFGLVTLGLAIPYASYRALAFKVNNTTFGQTRFSFHASVKQYYRAVFKAAMVSVLLLVPLLMLLMVLAYYLNLAASIAMVAQSYPGGEEGGSRVEAMLLAAVGYLTLFLLAYVYSSVANAYVTNLTYSHTCLADVRFRSTLSPFMLTWITVSNLLAILFSVGLLYPLAKLRMVRYRTSQLAISAPNGFDQFLAGPGSKVTATGEELADFFDVDIGI